MQESLRREVRTCASHCDRSLYASLICILDRHLHIILKVKKIQKYTQWTGPQPVKPFIFVAWPTVAGPQTGRIPYTKQSRANWERWLGRIPCCCCLRISRPQQFFGARRRAASAWLAEETRFPEIIPPVTILKAVGFIIQFRKKGVEHLFSIDNEVVNNLRRHTRAYVKKIGGLPIIHVLPRREYKKKDRPILADAVLVGDFEELVETALHH